MGLLGFVACGSVLIENPTATISLGVCWMSKAARTIKREVACCIGCGHNYEAIHEDSNYCHKACYQRHRRRPLPIRARFGLRQLPLTAVICKFRETLYRLAPPQAVYYSVTWLAMRETFPLAEETMRSTGLRSDLPGYALHPFEFPLVPLSDFFLVRFWSAGFQEIPMQKAPEIEISFTHPLPLKCRKELQEATKRMEKNRNRATSEEVRDEFKTLPSVSPPPRPKIDPPPRKKQIDTPGRATLASKAPQHLEDDSGPTKKLPPKQS